MLKTPTNCDNCPDDFVGLNYVYADSNNATLGLSPFDIDHSSSPIKQTAQDYTTIR